jgi:hypothetical protein
MEQQTFEGTWEEILAHAPKLTGRQVRLTILTGDLSQPPTETLDKLLKGRVGRVNFQPSNLSEQTREAFTHLLQEKHDSSKLNP